jgi:hypothetical protein
MPISRPRRPCLSPHKGAFNEAEEVYRRVGDNLPPRQALTRFIDFYLSAYHRDSPSNCPIVTLSSDLPRQSRKFRAAFNAGLKRLLGILARLIEAAGISDSETAAAATLSAMAGTMAIRPRGGDHRGPSGTRGGKMGGPSERGRYRNALIRPHARADLETVTSADRTNDPLMLRRLVAPIRQWGALPCASKSCRRIWIMVAMPHLKFLRNPLGVCPVIL